MSAGSPALVVRLRPALHAERAELHRLMGEAQGARRELTEAHRLFAEMGATGHAQRIAGILAAAPGSDRT